MKNLCFFISGCVCCLFLSFYQNSTTQKKVDTLNVFKEYFVGEFDNFQQCWQENTKTDNHRVAIEHKHRHLHSAMRPTNARDIFTVTHFEGDDTTKILGQRSVKLSESDGENAVLMKVFDQKDLEKPIETVKWTLNEGVFTGQQEGTTHIWKLQKEGLFVLNDRLFKNDSKEPFKMLRCRFFKGWIQLPMDNIKKDSVYHFGNLRIHDQGGKAQLRLPDGTLLNHTVELTQLVFGKNLPIMKLAVYEMPADQLDYNSHSISYTWTNPEAMRLGINLRKLISGWTLDDTKMWNSDSRK